MIIDAAERPPNPSCPTCDATLTYVDSEISSGAFRPQAASMPQMPIHYYDCPSCKHLLEVRDEAASRSDPPDLEGLVEPQVDLGQQLRLFRRHRVVHVDLVARVAHPVAALGSQSFFNAAHVAGSPSYPPL